MTNTHNSNKNKRAEFSHISPSGAAKMVDVGAKSSTPRLAIAEAWVDVGAEIAELLRQTGGVTKGNVLETARIAGITAAKRTAELIPMCHPLVLDSVEVSAELIDDRVKIVAAVSCEGKTGVEMEAMTAASVAALTIYDMVKSAGKGVQIGTVKLLEKRGGKSGHWKCKENDDGKN